MSTQPTFFAFNTRYDPSMFEQVVLISFFFGGKSELNLKLKGSIINQNL